MNSLDDILGGRSFGVAVPKPTPPPVVPPIEEASQLPLSVPDVPKAPPLLGGSPDKTPGSDAAKVLGHAPGKLPKISPRPSDDSSSPIADRSKLIADSSDAPRSKRQMSYVEMYEKMHPQKPESAEERARREKRERSRAVLAAVGDGISALSNLWFTSQYAPDMYNPTASARTQDRWDRLRRERQAREKEYFDGWLRAKALDDAAGKEDRQWQYKVARDKVADARADAKDKRDKALADLNEKLRNQQITAAEWKAEQERIKALYAEANERADLGYKNAGIQQRRAAAGAANASANASNAKADHYRSGAAAGKSKYTLTVGDKTYTYGTEADYNRAVERYASEYGVHPYEAYRDGTHTSGLEMGKPKYTTKRKSTAQLAAEVERKSAAKHAAEQKEADFSAYEVHDDEDDREDDDFSRFEM